MILSAIHIKIVSINQQSCTLGWLFVVASSIARSLTHSLTEFLAMVIRLAQLCTAIHQQTVLLARAGFIAATARESRELAERRKLNSMNGDDNSEIVSRVKREEGGQIGLVGWKEAASGCCLLLVGCRARTKPLKIGRKGRLLISFHWQSKQSAAYKMLLSAFALLFSCYSVPHFIIYS